MSEVQPGDNQIKSLVSRIESVEQDMRDRAEDRKEIYVEAKSAGFDTKALRAVIARRRADAKKLAQFEADVALYMQSLGMERL
jgi:uncharacterized protein (UPF0335 family)